MSILLSSHGNQLQQAAKTAFWTLCLINLIFTCYGVLADICGLSFFGRYPAPKYHMGAEAAFVCMVIISSFLMHLITGAFVWKASVKARWCSLLTTAFFFAYLSIPHF